MNLWTLDVIATVCYDLKKAAMAIQADNEEVIASNDHIAIVEHYNHLRIATAQIKEAREALNEIEEKLSREIIPNVFRSRNIKTTTIIGVGRVTVAYRYSCSMLDKDRGMEWLKETGNGSLIQPSVNAQTLAAFAKNRLEEEGLDMPDDIFKIGSNPYTSITKVK